GGGDLTPPRRLVQRRQRLGADEGRRDELVLGRDLDLAGSDPEERLAVNDEPSHAADAIRSARTRVASGRDDPVARRQGSPDEVGAYTATGAGDQPDLLAHRCHAFGSPSIAGALPYSSSVTCSPQATTFPSSSACCIAMW